MNPLIIIGAGAHARTVLELVQLTGIYSVIGFCADDAAIGTTVFGDHRIIDNVMLENGVADETIFFSVAIGDNAARKIIFENALKKFKPATLIHPKASVSVSATIGEGTVILANACINANATIGKNTIINIGVLVDHDCNVGAHVHLSVGTIAGCNAHIPDNYKTNTGQIIEPFSKLTNA